MNRKTIVLLTSAYPLYEGEFFLDDEIAVLSLNFEKIHILCFHDNQKKMERSLPKNVTVVPIENNTSIGLFNTYQCILKKELWSELYSIKPLFNKYPTFAHIKIMLKSFLIAQSILRHLETFLNGKNLDLKNTIFYSYWHDEKALALSLLKSKKNATICISRAHGWDVEYKRHTPAYLPFKKFIIEKLNQTYTISERGKTIFDTLLNAKLCFKTNIARLGKSNHRTPLFEKKSDKIIICSCSNLVSLKRVHLIIDLLKNIEKQNINWIHFGDGPLQKELSNYAKKSIPHVHFEFRGLVTNDLILDFYSQHFVDLFINFSEIEGIPVSIMEAQSAGIPVLATSVGGTPEIVNDDNGFLVEKDFDMHKICSLVTNFLDSNQDYQTEKRKFAFNNWQNKYNADKNYTSFAKALNEL